MMSDFLLSSPRFYASLLTMCILASCVDNENRVQMRPSNIPSTAVYAGGVDGGTWLSCVQGIKNNFIYLCERYDDAGNLSSEQSRYELKSVYWDNELETSVYSDLDRVKLEFDNADRPNEITLINKLVLVKIDTSIKKIK